MIYLLEVLSSAALTLTIFLATLYLIAISAGMLMSWYWRAKASRCPECFSPEGRYYVYNDPDTDPDTIFTFSNSHQCTNAWHS